MDINEIKDQYDHEIRSDFSWPGVTDDVHNLASPVIANFFQNFAQYTLFNRFTTLCDL